MAQLLRVPEVAAGATEVVLSAWLVAEGDEIAVGTAIAVVDTDKATVEIESDTAAVLLRFLVTPGTTVDVGAPMALLGVRTDLGREDHLMAELGTETSDQRTTLPRREVPGTEAESPADLPSPAPSDPAASGPPASSAPVPAGSGPGQPRRLFITPLARKLLTQAGLRPEEVRGSGPRGRITKRDVERAISEPAVPAPIVPAAPAQDTTAPTTTLPAGRPEPHSRLRKAVATRLTQSKRDVPHFYLKRVAVIDELMALRSQINEQAPAKVSVNDLVVRAVAVAHAAVPEVNAIWTDEATLHLDGVDVAVAVASDRGLVTPVVRNVTDRSISSIAGAIRDLVARANAGKLQQHELEGGSITVTNLGMHGVEEFAAIINPPQSCILAVGAGRLAPVVRDGELSVATQLSLVLSVDHRVVDGALAARWLAALVDALEQPLRLLV